MEELKLAKKGGGFLSPAIYFMVFFFLPGLIVSQGISIDCAIQDIRLMNRNVPSGYIMYESVLVEAESILPLQNQETYLST